MSGSQVVIEGPASLYHLTGNGNDELTSDPAGTLEIAFGAGSVLEEDLKYSASVSEIYEYKTTFVSGLLNPSHYCNFFTDVFF